MDRVKGRFAIAKADDEQRLAFGWASVAKSAEGAPLVDLQGDMIDIEDLEKAAYNFVELYREGGEMHERGDCAVMVESMVVASIACNASMRRIPSKQK